MDLQNKEVTWNLVVFSPDSHLLAGYSYEEDCIVTWDLQTGGIIRNIGCSSSESSQNGSMTFSECETMIGGDLN